MDTNLENISVAKLQSLGQQEYFKEEIETRIKAWIADATLKTRTLVEKHWQTLEKVALTVLDKETLDEAELLELIISVKK